MTKRASWYIFLVVSLLIGLGAVGHTLAAQKVHAAIDRFPIDSAIYQTLFLVWYMASGTMIAYGVILVWVAFRLAAGDTSALFIAYVLSAQYIVFGVCALIYRHGDPFWALFVVLGALLLGSSLVLRSGAAPMRAGASRLA